MKCQACNLYKNCINQVQQTGCKNGRILWLLDVPTKEEDITGKSGAGILAIIEAICDNTGLDFKASVFQNIVLCRPAIKRGENSVETTSEQILTCMQHVLPVANACYVDTVILCGKNVEKYYKSRITVPHLTIVDPLIVRGAGGFTSNTYIDTINKIRKWKYENNIA
jgi:uracil-DNA glycosylase family 4